MKENEGKNAVLRNFSISNGSAYAGGGVYIEFGATPMFNHVIWIRNVAQAAGGGVLIDGSNTNPTFYYCKFQENKALEIDNGGGAVYIQLEATPIFNHVIWIRNVAQGAGGGVYITHPNTATFNNCTFQENKALDNGYGSNTGGGGIFIRAKATPIFNHVIWIRNVAKGGGGGVFITDSNTNPTFNNHLLEQQVYVKTQMARMIIQWIHSF